MNRLFGVRSGYLGSCHNRQPVAVAVRRNLAEKPDRTGLPDTMWKKFGAAVVVERKKEDPVALFALLLFQLFTFLVVSVMWLWSHDFYKKSPWTFKKFPK